MGKEKKQGIRADRPPTLGKNVKLPPLAPGARVQKRALMKRPAHRAGPGMDSSRVVYVSSGTPLMAAVRRVRKKLDASLRAATAVDTRAAPRGAGLQSRISNLKRDMDAAAAAESEGALSGEEVVIMGTGKAIEKVLGLAGWFEQEGDCMVEVRTRTVGTVDDVVAAEDDEEAEDESRVRKMSCLEVSVRLR